MKTIVLGNGYLGNRISQELNYPLFPLKIGENTKELKNLLDSEQPTHIISAIGKTGKPNIDWCETHKLETMTGNVLAPYLLLKECLDRNIHLTHIGSGCIYEGGFDGEGFTESDEPNFFGPQFYAKTKIIAEKILGQFPCLQLRIRMPLDDRVTERNLIDKLKKYTKIINVQNSMTTVPDLIPVINHLVEKNKTGIYNVVNPGTISASEIMKLYQTIVDPAHSFEIFSVEELNKITIGKRSNCKLSSEKLKLEGIVLPEIHEAVENCLKNYARTR